jgi:predicted Ser/Thr protein kinase
LIRTAAAAAVVLALSCLPAGADEWFDAYARGLEALRQRQGAQAAALFERAIRLRAEPGANLITYGTNRLDRYHPYLRLAEARLLAGEPEKAKEALARSAARGKEPADERARLLAQAEEALAKARAAAATPAPPSTVAALPPTTLAPATLAAAPPATLPEAPPTTLARAATPVPSATARRPTSDTLERVPAEVTPAPPAPPAVTSLIVYSQPPGAALYLDDELLGVTDPRSGRLVKTGVAPGSHRLRASLAGHEDASQDVDLAASGPTTVHTNLSPSAEGLSPTALAAAAAAVLALGGAGLWMWRRKAALATGRGSTVALSSDRLPPGADTHATTRTGPRTPVSPPMGDEVLERETVALPSGTKVSADQDRFGDYRLLEALGKGGMATVYKAERRGDVCALKRPLPAFLEDPEFRQRFLREAEIGRTLHHPNIIRILERGEVGGVPFFTMELVEGETLQSYVRRRGALPPKEAARVVAQVAEALDYAHLKGVVHRDLKPSNIMVVGDGTVKVMDYGIARARRFEGLTLTGAFMGTPDYVAPETAEGKGTDARSDLYSLGIVFYEILTGKKPFVGETPFATLRKHCTELPTPPSVISPGTPREVEAIVLQLLRKDPAERYPGAEELLIALREFINRAA